MSDCHLFIAHRICVLRHPTQVNISTKKTGHPVISEMTRLLFFNLFLLLQNFLHGNALREENLHVIYARRQ